MKRFIGLMSLFATVGLLSLASARAADVEKNVGAYQLLMRPVSTPEGEYRLKLVPLAQAEAADAPKEPPASMQHLKQLTLGVYIYAGAHKDRLPNTLEDIKPHVGGEAAWKKLMTHPVTGRFPGFRYVKPGEMTQDVKDAAQHPVLVEAFDQWPGLLSFAFADGHVEAIADRQKAQELLKMMKIDLPAQP